jgi:hypothetical protein
MKGSVTMQRERMSKTILQEINVVGWDVVVIDEQGWPRSVGQIHTVFLCFIVKQGHECTVIELQFTWFCSRRRFVIFSSGELVILAPL